MDFFKNLTGASSQQAKQGGGSDASTSLLSDWVAYSNKTAPTDVEAGGAVASTSSAGSTSATLLSNVDAAGARVSSFFSDSFTKVSSTVSTGVTAVTSGESFSLPTGQNLVYFFSFLGGGCIFLLLAFTLFLPTIILSPSKFALSFTLGCLCFMGGFAMLRGWKQQMAHMFSKERLPFSVAYIGSVVATLYAALIMHSYLLCLLCSGLQVVALLYYLMSYFPGGANGVRMVLGLFYNAVMQCFGTVTRMVLK